MLDSNESLIVLDISMIKWKRISEKKSIRKMIIQ
ncbi:MAG: hypothetical protein ACI8TA_002671 [Cyclobacteriaceae bacterium]|jgi:hypothetical protein